MWFHLFGIVVLSLSRVHHVYDVVANLICGGIFRQYLWDSCILLSVVVFVFVWSDEMIAFFTTGFF